MAWESNEELHGMDDTRGDYLSVLIFGSFLEECSPIDRGRDKAFIVVWLEQHPFLGVMEKSLVQYQHLLCIV